MIDPKLRDALAERLNKLYAEEEQTGFIDPMGVHRDVASRLLESVPGEEELARKMRDIWYNASGPGTRDDWEQVARFLRSKILGWVG